MASYEQHLKDIQNEEHALQISLEHKRKQLLELENNFINVDELQALRDEVQQKADTIVELQLLVNNKNVVLDPQEQEEQEQEEKQNFEAVLQQSQYRIRELENALRESVKITTEREMVLRREENKRKQIMEKVIRSFWLTFCKISKS